MLITALSTVLLPKISKAFAENRLDDAKEYLYRSYNFVWFLGAPLMFGAIGIADTLVPVFFGDGFEPAIQIIPIMSTLFIFMGLASTSGSQYFTATGKQDICTKIILLGGLVNFALNFVLIPSLLAKGAAIASVTGEFAIMAIEFAYIKKKKMISVTKVFAMSWKYLISGGIMLVAIRLLTSTLQTSAITLLLLIIIGAIAYFIALIILRDKFILSFITKGKDIISKKLKG